LTMAPSDKAKASLLNLVDNERTSEGRAVVDGRTRGDIEAKPDLNAWQVVAPPWTVNEVRCDAKAGYLDRKWALHGTSKASWLALTVAVDTQEQATKSSRGFGTPLALCEVACLWGKCPKGRGSLLEDVEFELDSSSSALPGVGGQQAGGPRRQQQNGKLKAIMPDERDKGSDQLGSPLLRLLMKSKVCVEVTHPDGSSLSLTPGNHELRLRINKPDTYVLLSHMIWY